MILIWTNTREWGGVVVLAMRFAEFLRAQGVRFAIVEPEGSRLRGDLPWADFVTAEEAPNLTSEVRHLFLPTVASCRDETLPWNAFSQARLFTWIVQPLEPLTGFVPAAAPLVNRFGFRMVRPLLWLLREHVRLVRGLFSRLVETGGLAVMDDSAIRYLRYCYPDVPAPRVIIPIPAPLGSKLERKSRNTSALTVGYLGRADAVKLSALRPLIAHDLAAVARTRPVELLAITNEESRGTLQAICDAAGVRLRFEGFLPNAEARRMIRSETDLAVAMGTSALDIAATGHPCVVIDVSIRPDAPPQPGYRFLHESTDNSLGEYRDFPGYVAAKHSFADIIATLESQDLSDLARSYVAREHDPETCFAALLERVMASETNVGDIGRRSQAIARSIASIGRYYQWATRGRR